MELTTAAQFSGDGVLLLPDRFYRPPAYCVDGALQLSPAGPRYSTKVGPTQHANIGEKILLQLGQESKEPRY